MTQKYLPLYAFTFLTNFFISCYFFHRLNQMNGNKSNSFTDNFTNVEIKILELVKNEPTISQSKLAEIICISKRTITTSMNKYYI